MKSTNERGLRVFRLKMWVLDSLTDEQAEIRPICHQITVDDTAPPISVRKWLHQSLDKILDKWEKENENS